MQCRLVAFCFGLSLAVCSGCNTLTEPYSFVDTVTDTSSIRKVAVFPFQNNTTSSQASSVVTNAFIAELFQKKKYRIEFPGNVRSFLLGERILIRDGLDLETIDMIARRLEVDAVIVGEVDEFIGLDDRTRSVVPVVAVRSRMVAGGSGRILWMAQHERKGDDYIKVLDLGKIRSVAALARRVVGEMIDSMP